MADDWRTCPHPELVERWESGPRGGLDTARRGQSVCARCGVGFGSLPQPELDRLRMVYGAAERFVGSGGRLVVPDGEAAEDLSLLVALFNEPEDLEDIGGVPV